MVGNSNHSVLFSILTAATLLLSCTLDAHAGDSATKDTFGRQNIFIMPVTAGLPGILGFSLAPWNDLREFWEPTAEQVNIAEASVNEYIDKFNKEHPGPYPVDLTRYHRQYIGIVVNGKRYVLGNFYVALPTFLHNEPTKFIFGIDGGMSFFRIAIDPETGRVAEFESNGVA